MANTVVGRILKIGSTTNVSKQKEFLKRELVLDCSRYDEFSGEKRENYVALTFTQKRCEELNGFQAGELVEVSFILNGRKYDKDGQTRFITDIMGYKIERKGAQQGVSAVAPQATPPQPVTSPQVAPHGGYEPAPQTAQNPDLPF